MPSVTEQPLPGSCHGLAPRQEGTGTYRLCIRLTQKQQSESSGFKYGVKCAEEGALSTHTGGGKSWELSGGQAGRQAGCFLHQISAIIQHTQQNEDMRPSHAELS